MRRIKLVAIKSVFFNIFDFPTEIMDEDRPFLIILKLKYKGKTQSFALPFRSNIQVNKNTEGLYFPLPRRTTTKKYHAHGLHYIKLFPVNNQYFNKFIVRETKYNTMLMEFVEKNISTIVEETQNYLIKYENGERYQYCTDIDRMLIAIDEHESAKLTPNIPETQIAAALTSQILKDTL